MRWSCANAALLAAAVGRGGAATFDWRAYRSGALAFDVGSVPADWRRIELEGAALAFRDDAHDASIVVSGRCGLRVDDTPLEALTNHLLIGTTERAYEREETRPFDGREARFTTVLAKLDGVPMRYDVVVLKKDGCVYDFVYVAPPAPKGDASDAAGRAAFAGFVGAFHTAGARP